MNWSNEVLKKLYSIIALVAVQCGLASTETGLIECLSRRHNVAAGEASSLHQQQLSSVQAFMDLHHAAWEPPPNVCGDTPGYSGQHLCHSTCSTPVLSLAYTCPEPRPHPS